ncbi:MAG TPA: hypothetical protein VG452_11480, partial [Egibacteraceae bacterium]|nr:hypothetical protein [Egibacteraceae bacterium]
MLKTARVSGALLCALVTLAGACAPPVPGTVIDSAAVDLDDWNAVRERAHGQTVRWWLYGGDDRVNRYIDEHVTPAAAERGITLRRIPVADTAGAVQRVVAESQANKTDGSVDLIWVNGENFALGRRSGLWLDGWAGRLPNARYVDPATVEEDFG